MRRTNRRLAVGMLFAAVVAVSNSGCGGGAASPSAPPPLPISVSVSPTTATVLAGKTAQFTATVANDSANKGVTWAVSCSVASCGSVSPSSTASGAPTTYTPPAPPANDLSVTLTATSVADSTKSASASITVPAITVSVASNVATVDAGATAPFTATVTNDGANKGVTWSVSCSAASCGSVSPISTASGAPTTYTPPAPPATDLTVTLKGASAADPTKFATVTITVPAIKMFVAPTSNFVVVNKTDKFTATVQNDGASKGATWTLTQAGAPCSSGCGAVAPASTASGTPTTYTAPATVPANPTVTITATSVADSTKSASAKITIVLVARNSVPFINQPLVPPSVAPGGAAFTLTVNGTGFVVGSVVNWNGSARATTFVSSSQLTASILASDIAKPATASITIVNPSPGGGTSNVVFLEVTPSSASVGFSGSTFPTANGPLSAATGDFNADGKIDLVVPDPGSGSVSILLGNGDGTFQPAVNYAVGQGSSSQFFQVAVGDFNGDGKPDFAVSDFLDNNVNVFIGNGDGTFKAAVSYGVGTNPTSVAVADLNGDGVPDLVVSNQNCTAGGPPCGTGTVSILLGNGDGSFQTHSDFAAGTGANWVTVGDFNGDGKLDLAVVNGNAGGPSALLILLGNGDGTFQAPVSYALKTNGASAATADFNGDGNLDIAVVDNIGLVSIFLGKGDGTFQPRVDYPAGSFPIGSVGIADFNGDGKLDLAVANSGSKSVSVFLGNGDGTFQTQVQFPVGNSPHAVAAADFNQDGRLDLAVPNLSDNTVSVLLQIPTVSLLPPSINFGNQLVGVASAAQPVTLTNNGPGSLSISSVGITGTNATDFSETNNCDSSVSVGASCTINATFTPSQVGPRTASLAITDNGFGSPQTVSSSGTGLVTGPNATLSPTTLTFATQLVGTSSPAQAVTLSNFGTAAVAITTISASGDFSETNNCPASLASVASCTINVTFTPTTAGKLSGTLSVTDSAPGSPQTVSLKGVGTFVKLNPASLNFGSVKVGNSSTMHTTLTNTATTALSITSIAITGTGFSGTNTCPASVAAGGSCTITVTFRPPSIASFAGDVTTTDSDPGSPQQVPLSGRGIRRLREASIRSALARNKTIAVPSTTGPNHVGTRVMDLVDSKRDDPYPANGTKRELLVRFWYPASVSEGCNQAQYTSPAVWNHFGELVGVRPFEVKTNSCLDAPIAEGIHPLVVFTPGYTVTFTDYTFLFEDLASRGYVVVAVDHTYEATAVEFPDGRFVKSVFGSYLGETLRSDAQSLSIALFVRLGDLEFVVNELENLNADSDSPFAGKLDITKIALAGHSLGGLATILGLEQDPRFKAGVIIDGVVPEALVSPTETPVLILAAGREQWSDNECRLWDSLRGARLTVNLKGTEHLTPSDAVWLAKGAIQTGNMGLEKTIAALRDYIAAFLDTNLRGRPMDPLLTGPSPDFPDADVITQSQALCGDGQGVSP